MKKNILILTIAFLFSSNLFSQDTLKNKNGAVVLPEKGDFMIGIDSRPFFQYIGNMFNGNLNNTAPTFSFTQQTPLSLNGKYMINEKTALRMIFRFAHQKFKDVEQSLQDGQEYPNINYNLMVDDIYTNKVTNFTIGMGLEKRRGKRRLQGLYGIQALISINTNNKEWDYGNRYSSNNNHPTRTEFHDNYTSNGWLLNYDKGTELSIGLQAFIGVEYFFAPKISISGEFNYGLIYNTNKEDIKKIERWDYEIERVEVIEKEIPGDTYFGLDTGVTGALNFNFYF